MVLTRALNLAALVLVAASFWVANLNWPNDFFLRGFYTFLALAIIYFIFKLIFEEIISGRIKTTKTKYSFRKAVSALWLVISLVIVLRIWVTDPQALLVSYGLIAAGVAIALQDFFKNFVGGILIFTSGLYRVGDRIELNNKFGDVIDIGIMYTTLMEMKEWVAGDQATGRLTTIPNGWVLNQHLNNYTKGHEFIWDEITVPITYDSDWKAAHDKILRIVKHETAKYAEQAAKDITRLEEKYYLSKRPTEPMIFMTMTDNWITFNIRYVTEARQRRFVHNTITQKILEEIQASRNIKIASQTLDIIGFPGAKTKEKK